MRWSRLKSLITALWVEELGLDIHCTSYRRENSSNLGRYWITLNKETIWEVPGNFRDELSTGVFDPVASDVTVLLREYLDTPRDEVMSREYPNDRWGLIDVLRAADRRIGKARLKELAARPLLPAAVRILNVRFPE